MANVETSPVLGSIRTTLPALPSVAYNAPPGPMVLPEPRPLPKVARTVSSGASGGGLALAFEGMAIVERAAVANKIINALLTATFLPRFRGHAIARLTTASPDPGPL